MPFLQKIRHCGGKQGTNLSYLNVTRTVAWLERFQIPLYGCAVVAALLLGWRWPAAGEYLTAAVDPAVVVLISATFCAVPFYQLSAALLDGKFLVSLVILNFLITPMVVALLCFLLIDDPSFLLPIALVLLAPCVDYVIVFSRMAGGKWQSLLAATPVLMLVQMAVLPVYLSVIPHAGAQQLQWQPFVRAFCLFIVLPLIVAAVLQICGAKVMAVVELLMVPLLCATLFIVAGAFSGTILAEAGRLWSVVPVFVVFGVVMPILGNFWGKWWGFDAETRCVVSFSATTRNSLVVLPFALALVPVMPLAPVVVVSQTVVELIIMVVLVASWRQKTNLR